MDPTVLPQRAPPRPHTAGASDAQQASSNTAGCMRKPPWCSTHSTTEVCMSTQSAPHQPQQNCKPVWCAKLALPAEDRSASPNKTEKGACVAACGRGSLRSTHAAVRCITGTQAHDVRHTSASHDRHAAAIGPLRTPAQLQVNRWLRVLRAATTPSYNVPAAATCDPSHKQCVVCI
jgi:hypothetical protein